MTKKAIAFCISGQLRDDHLSLPHTSRIAKELDASVFISVWRNRGTKSSGAFNYPQLLRMFGEDFAFSIPIKFAESLHQFPELFSAIEAAAKHAISEEDIRRHFDNAVIDIEQDDVLDLDFDMPRQDRNSIRMLYKAWKCGAMKRKFERQAGKKFDIVVRFRPDTVPPVRSVLSSLHIDDETVYVLGKKQPGFVNDMLSISSSATDDLFAVLFGRVLEMANRQWKGIHVELEALYNDNQISIVDISGTPLIEDGVARQTKNRVAFLSALRTLWTNSSDVLPVTSEALRALSLINKMLLNVTSEDRSVNIAALVAQTKSVAGLQAVSGALALHCIHENPADTLVCHILRLASVKEQKPSLHMSDGVAGNMFWAVLNFERFLCQATSTSKWFADRIQAKDRIYGLLDKAETLLSQGTLASVCLEIDEFRASSPHTLSRTFHALQSTKQEEAAQRVALQIIDRFPDSWVGYDHMGHLASAAGDFESALDWANKALSFDQTHWGLHARIGKLLIDSGNSTGGIQHFEEALNFTNEAIVWKLYGDALAANRIEKELRGLHRRAEDSSVEPEVLDYLGNLCAGLQPVVNNDPA